MNDPLFHIRLGRTSQDASVVVNGQDISHALRGVMVRSDVGKETMITLMVGGRHARVIVEGACQTTITEQVWADLGRPESEEAMR